MRLSSVALPSRGSYKFSPLCCSTQVINGGEYFIIRLQDTCCGTLDFKMTQSSTCYILRREVLINIEHSIVSLAIPKLAAVHAKPILKSHGCLICCSIKILTMLTAIQTTLRLHLTPTSLKASMDLVVKKSTHITTMMLHQLRLGLKRSIPISRKHIPSNYYRASGICCNCPSR